MYGKAARARLGSSEETKRVRTTRRSAMTMELAQRLQLGVHLDALGDDLRPDAPREVHERLQQAPLDEAAVDVAHERDVELQEVGLDLDERLQAGVAGAHVVDGDAEALELELA